MIRAATVGIFFSESYVKLLRCLHMQVTLALLAHAYPHMAGKDFSGTVTVLKGYQNYRLGMGSEGEGDSRGRTRHLSPDEAAAAAAEAIPLGMAHLPAVVSALAQSAYAQVWRSAGCKLEESPPACSSSTPSCPPYYYRVARGLPILWTEPGHMWLGVVWPGLEYPPLLLPRRHFQR
jgi:hypothetical protein